MPRMEAVCSSPVWRLRTSAMNLIGVSRRKGSMVAAYIPDRGDIIWLNFPALVLSPKAYKENAGQDFARKVLARFMPLVTC